MTDLIHEPPKEEAPADVLRTEEPELSAKTGQKRVYGYIFILFVVAFSLLLWAFFMNQRGTDQVLSELRGNADALQTTLARNVELEQRVDELERRLAEAEKQQETLRGENRSLAEERDALADALSKARNAQELREEEAEEIGDVSRET